MAQPTASDTQGLIRSLVSVPIFFLVMGVLLFWPAGTLSWGRGWWLLAVFAISVVAGMAYLWRVNPEIYTARSSVGAGTKGWDLVMVPLAFGSLLAVGVIAALDDARFHWLPLADWVIWLGYLLFVAGFALSIWALAVNRHFEPTVRIQSERGHQVIDSGPYAAIRHPGYAAGILLAVGMALGLGSLWALIPAAVFLALLAYRTLREEDVLRAELPGYRAYAERVRYRWVPGLW